MLTCRACLWRCIQAVNHDAAAAHAQLLRRNALSTTRVRSMPVVRAYSDRPVRRVEPKSKAPEMAPEKRESQPWHQSTQAAGLKMRERRALKRQPATTLPAKGHDSKAIGVRPPRKMGRRDPSVSSQDYRLRKKELQYLADPLELANFVKQELAKDKTKEMVDLVRMASNSMQCIVSWNHIINHLLDKGQIGNAVKLYNDMKKRAQFPDAYTYTILLRGLAANAQMTGALAKALSIYHSLSAPNSRVQPSIIHTNAVLKVAARAADMDALWGVAGKIPESGPGAANAVTYGTIISAIRQNLLVNVPAGESELQVAARREQGIVDARRIWCDVIGKWKNADLVIEEELVCAIGRLLLIGSRPRDWDDVLSLVEQTMDIPRLVPRLGSPARQEAGLPRVRAPNTPDEFKFDDDHLSPSKAPPRGDEFMPVTTHAVGGATSNPLRYATPGNNTLSLILEACQKVVANKAAQEYWDMLTDPTTYNIVPDVNNLHHRLRIMRQNRASADAVELLRLGFIEGKEKARPGTFRIAMSTCVRDKNNHNSLRHAGQILAYMTASFEDADPKTVGMYAELANDFPLKKAADLIDALKRLDPIVQNLRLQLTIGAEPKDATQGSRQLGKWEREDALFALRKVFGVYDKLINEGYLSEQEKKPFMEQRSKLAGFLNRIRFKVELGTKRIAKERAERKSRDAGEGSSAKDQVEEAFQEREGALPVEKPRGTGGEARQARKSRPTRRWSDAME